MKTYHLVVRLGKLLRRKENALVGQSSAAQGQVDLDTLDVGVPLDLLNYTDLN